MRTPPSLPASVQCFALAMLCALLREDGACGIRLQSGESKGRYKNSSATHTPTHRKAQVTQEQLLAALAAAGAVFAAAATRQHTPFLRSHPRALAGCSCAWGQLMLKPSCNRRFALVQVQLKLHLLWQLVNWLPLPIL